MTDKLEERAKAEGEQLAKEAHCRYCDRWQGTPHPAERCKGDVEGMAEEITKTLLSFAQEARGEVEVELTHAKLKLNCGSTHGVCHFYNDEICARCELAQARAEAKRWKACHDGVVAKKRTASILLSGACREIAELRSTLAQVICEANQREPS